MRRWSRPTPEREPAWRLGGELDWDEVEGLRILSARLDAERLLAVAALRPKDAQGHGEELVTGALGDDGTSTQLDEALLSTEYGPDGAVRRIGLELYREQDGLPIRIAGDVIATSSETTAARCDATPPPSSCARRGDRGSGSSTC